MGVGGCLEPPKVPIGFLNFHHVFLLEKNICLCFSKGSEKKTKGKSNLNLAASTVAGRDFQTFQHAVCALQGELLCPCRRS